MYLAVKSSKKENRLKFLTVTNTGIQLVLQCFYIQESRTALLMCNIVNNNISKMREIHKQNECNIPQ